MLKEQSDDDIMFIFVGFFKCKRSTSNKTVPHAELHSKYPNLVFFELHFVKSLMNYLHSISLLICDLLGFVEFW